MSAVRFLILATLLAAFANAQPATPEDVFSEKTLHRIEITVPADLYKLLDPGTARKALKGKADAPIAADIDLRDGPVPESFAYVRASVTFDGQTLDNVGLRYKGHLSYSSSRTAIRRPMKLDFERFTPGQHFARLTEINLNNHAVDPSQAREALAFSYFRTLGLAAPRTGYALVYLNVPTVHDHLFLGLYTLIEEVDHHFLKRNFHTDNGLLCKPGGMRGLAYLGEEWKAYESKLHPKDPAEPAYAQRMIDLARLINQSDDATFAAQIGDFVDLHAFLRYVAVNSALCNFDSFLSTGHNYYLYLPRADRPAIFIPWDMNMSFGGYSWVGTDEQIADTRITHAYVDHNRIIERVLAIPEHRQAYLTLVRQLINGPMSPEQSRQQLVFIQQHIRAAGQAAAAANLANSPTTRPLDYERVYPPDLQWFIDHRAASIRAQLDQNAPGYLPAFNNPDRVPAGWANAVAPSLAIMKVLDADKDNRISEAEFSGAVTRTLQAANLNPDEPLDLVAVNRGLSAVLPQDATLDTVRAWSGWLFKQADTNRDGRLTTGELTAFFTRLVTRSDHDHDNQLASRELLEALTSTGCPKPTSR